MAHRSHEIHPWSVVLAFAGGAAVGGLTALLLAPRSGAETRQKIHDAAQRGRERLARIPERMRAAGRSARESVAEATGQAGGEDPH